MRKLCRIFAISAILLGSFLILNPMSNGPAAISGIYNQALAISTADAANQVERQITTTIKDHNHPDEPWVVTTYGLPDESDIALIKRHGDMVEAVRRALNE